MRVMAVTPASWVVTVPDCISQADDSVSSVTSCLSEDNRQSLIGIFIKLHHHFNHRYSLPGLRLVSIPRMSMGTSALSGGVSSMAAMISAAGQPKTGLFAS
jgi:hypothetical protein